MLMSNLPALFKSLCKMWLDRSFLLLSPLKLWVAEGMWFLGLDLPTNWFTFLSAVMKANKLESGRWERTFSNSPYTTLLCKHARFKGLRALGLCSVSLLAWYAVLAAGLPTPGCGKWGCSLLPHPTAAPCVLQASPSLKRMEGTAKEPSRGRKTGLGILGNGIASSWGGGACYRLWDYAGPSL